MRAPSSPSPEAWASKWATVEPSGPAGSSRPSVSSSTATSTAMAVSSLVTDARGSGVPIGPVDATGAEGDVTPTAAVRTGQRPTPSKGDRRVTAHIPPASDHLGSGNFHEQVGTLVT